ncbi:MAG: carboxypeptidase regulatory-like domain-containing protein [Candidatus Omnitrophica bacterium]|nr:carboxypeptidase regulatory-like domain-containing protein [Candidatus Omnitrophota bacterium]
MKKIAKLVLIVSIFTFLAGSNAFSATVSGKVNFSGTAPAPEQISMDADPTCAGLHPDPVYTEDVVVNADQTLRNVFVYVKEGLEGKTFPTPTESIVMDQKGCHYTPHVYGIQVGQKLDIVNSDSTLHNVHGMPTQSKEFNMGMPIQGMKLSKSFDKPEVMVKFKCDVHPWMRAYAGVLTHPFYSVTGEAGTFEIKNLPAGTYTVEAWHEVYGTQTQKVTVDEAGAQTVDFSFTGK